MIFGSAIRYPVRCTEINVVTNIRAMQSLSQKPSVVKDQIGKTWKGDLLSCMGIIKIIRH